MSKEAEAVATDQSAWVEDVTLKRLLARPPDDRTKVKPGASPKKPGRRAKRNVANKE
jgi:hypothetical protein